MATRSPDPRDDSRGYVVATAGCELPAPCVLDAAVDLACASATELLVLQTVRPVGWTWGCGVDGVAVQMAQRDLFVSCVESLVSAPVRWSSVVRLGSLGNSLAALLSTTHVTAIVAARHEVSSLSSRHRTALASRNVTVHSVRTGT